MTKSMKSFSPSISNKTQRKSKKQLNNKQKNRKCKTNPHLKPQSTKSIQLLEFVPTTVKVSRTVYTSSSPNIVYRTRSNFKCLNLTI